MYNAEEPIHLAGATLGEHRHICAFFRNPDEEYQVLLPFIKEGFERGDKHFHIVDPQLREEHLRRLVSATIDARSAERTGQLELSVWEQVYWRQGSFDQDRMLALVQEVLDGSMQEGFPLTRLVSHMEWALQDRPGANKLIEYEARFNQVLPGRKDVVVCTYDLSKFGAGIVMDVLRTHPTVILGGVLQVNPFFVPPEEFLRELRDRDASAGSV